MAKTPKCTPRVRTSGGSRGTRAKSASVASRPTSTDDLASSRIDQRIRELADWRGATLARVRALITRALPDVVEEWKWNVPVWSHAGIVCTGEVYTKAVKLTFARGAHVPDPARLFNASLSGGTRRAIDLHEGERLNARAFTALVRAAAAVNNATVSAGSTKKALRTVPKPPRTESKASPAVRPPRPARAPVLLAGGNPQIAKADGDAPVQAYIAAMPGWKRQVGERLDALITRAVPKVRKAVKWNSPFYGIDGQGWLVSFHTFTHYVKVTFFSGTSLRPSPPGGTAKEARWIDVHEDDLDEAQLTRWLKQAARLPGWMAGGPA